MNIHVESISKHFRTSKWKREGKDLVLELKNKQFKPFRYENLPIENITFPIWERDNELGIMYASVEHTRSFHGLQTTKYSALPTNLSTCIFDSGMLLQSTLSFWFRILSSLTAVIYPIRMLS